MIYFLVLFFLLTVFFAYFCIKFALIILNVQSVIEESLDIIEDKYKKINDIYNIPVFFDSPEIKKLLYEIEDTRDTVLNIANKFSSSMSKRNIETKDKEKESD